MRMLAGHGLLSRGMLLRGHALASSVSPLALFAGGVIGVWFDPSDRTTLFEDVSGTIPATLPGQPVGLMLDKSKGLVLGVELVANGGFDNATSWVVSPQSSISGGKARIVSTDGSFQNVAQTKTLPGGKWYELRFDVTERQAGAVQFAFSGGGVNLGVVAGAVGSYRRFFFVAGTASSTLDFFRSGVTDITIDNVSVRELPGYHATQPVAASRPTLARHPKGGRRNLATQTGNLADAAWSKLNAAVSGSGEIPPAGTTAAWLVTASGAANVYQSIPLAAGDYTPTIFVKRGTSAIVSIAIVNVVDAINYNFDTKAIGGVSASTATATDVGDGWVKLSFWRNCSAASFGPSIKLANSGDTVHVAGVQFELGRVATPYQKVASQYDVTEAGVPDCWGLMFDGVDDFMVTPAIDLTATDKVGVFAGVRKLVDPGSYAAVVEFSTNASSIPNTFVLFGGGPNAVNGYHYRTSGSVQANVSDNTYPAPTTNVVTSLSDIAGDTATLRVDGSQKGQAVTDQGTGSFGNYPLYIGRRGGTTLPFNGILNELIVAGKLPSAAEITNTETFLNNKMGAY